MPIIAPEGCEEDRLFSNLGVENVPVISAEEAGRRDIRPARIGLLNLMPASAMEATEVQWLRWMGQGILQIDPIMIKFDNDKREGPGKSRSEILASYTPFSQAAELGLDALVVTGDNQEIKPSEGFSSGVEPQDHKELHYYEQLVEVNEWAKQNVPTTVYSCLGAHFALKHFFGIERDATIGKKIFGVYEHFVLPDDSPFTTDLNTTIQSPHSRWGNVSVDAMREETELKVLAVSEKVGWLLAQAANKSGGLDLFIQGHPEYYKRDLGIEYDRDKFGGQSVPENYFVNDDPNRDIKHMWRTDARALHGNVISVIYDRISRE